MAQFCTRCGKPLPAEVRFCPYCGGAVVAPAAPSSTSVPVGASFAPIADPGTSQESTSSVAESAWTTVAAHAAPDIPPAVTPTQFTPVEPPAYPQEDSVSPQGEAAALGCCCAGTFIRSRTAGSVRARLVLEWTFHVRFQRAMVAAGSRCFAVHECCRRTAETTFRVAQADWSGTCPDPACGSSPGGWGGVRRLQSAAKDTSYEGKPVSPGRRQGS